MTNRPPIRRLALAVTLALTLSAFVVALLGPAQTLAQAHKASCSGAVHAKAKRGAHACAQSSHKPKTKHHAKHASKKKTHKKTHRASQATVPASCEDGSAPLRAGDGSFSCDDGSEPECEGGATPAASRNGKSLVCLVAAEDETGASEAECEEEGLGCSFEQACEASGEDSSSACESED